MLGGCLESIKDWVDEMIVVDTGSTDRTKEIALEHGAKVFDFEWVQDFAAARNFAKAQTQCDYVIALDADERFNGADGSKLRERLNEQTTNVGFIRLTDAVSIHDSVEDVLYEQQSTPTFLPRILKNVEGNDWVGRVHEAPTYVFDAFYLKVDLVHLGADKEFRSSKRKGERNLKLLEQIIAEDPDQPPIFFSYLAGEREAVGDIQGFYKALEIGWHKILAHIEQNTDDGYANAGLISLYPAVLLSQNRFQEGLSALGQLIENLSVFSTNAANTLYQVLQTCMQIPFSPQLKDAFHELLFEASEFLVELDGLTFPEPTISGATSYKALQMQILALGKLKRFDEAFVVLEKAYAYSDATFATQLDHLELLIEQGDLATCLDMYTDLLKDNLHTSPDIWVLGALLLIVMGQQDDATEYIRCAMEILNRKFLSRHRINLLKGLHTRMCVLNGTPMAGIGAYGVVGAILAREPIETSHQIPSTLIEFVVERYVGLGKIEALLPFFDPRAEEILPGCGAIVKAKLESYGVELEDDGQKIPIVLFGRDLEEVMPLFVSHPNLNILSFTEEEMSLVSEEINDVDSQVLDDLLFGSMDLFEDEEDDGLSRSKEILLSKYQGMEGEPVLVWPKDWPVSAIENLCPERRAVMYLGSPLKHADTSQALYQWHINNTEVPNVLESNLFYLNARMMKNNPSRMVHQLMAQLGVASTEVNTAEIQGGVDWDQVALSERFTAKSDVDILNVWKFL